MCRRSPELATYHSVFHLVSIWHVSAGAIVQYPARSMANDLATQDVGNSPNHDNFCILARVLETLELVPAF